MKIQQLIKGTFLFTACITIFILTTAQYDNPSNGKTGGPGEGQCSDCHTQNNPNFDGNLEITGLPAEVFTGRKYNIEITVRATQGNPFNAGIQMITLDGNNFNTGELKNPRGISGVVQFGDRIYFEHKGSPTKFSDGTASWSVDWVAPETITNPEVHLFAATILGNGDSTDQGDLQILTNLSSTLLEGDPPLTSEANISEITCGGYMDGSINLDVSGGVLPYRYLWNTGDTTSSLSNLGPGTYSVVINDADTSSTQLEVTLNESPELVLDVVTVTTLGCSGQNDASALLQIEGGNPPYHITWPDGDTSLSKENLAIGDYIVVATDNTGCMDTAIVTVDAMSVLQINLVGIDESAPGANDGLAFITPEGGTPPYLVAWGNGSNQDTIMNLSPGVYSVIVADSEGCLVLDSVEIRAGVCNIPIETNQTHVSCNGLNDGTAMIISPDASAITSYTWSSGDTTRMVTGLTAGSYIVQIRDTMGCQGLDTVLITEPVPLTINIKSISDASCDLNGSVSFTISGGTEPYEIYSPDFAEASDSIATIGAGSYEFFVDDANGCMDSLSFSISSIDNDPPILRRSEYTLFLDENGNAHMDSVPVDSLIFDACGVDSVWFSTRSFNCTSMATPIAIQAWDENLNRLNGAILINVLDTIAPKLDFVDTIFVNSCDSVAYTTPLFMDNCAVDSVFFQSGLPSGSIFPDGLNEIVFQARDASGNSRLGKLIILVEISLDYSIEKTSIDCPTDSLGTIVINHDPEDLYSFQWNTGLINDTITNLPAGQYMVSITDTTGCSAIEQVNIESPLYEIQVDTIISKNDSGEGQIQVSILGGSPPFDFLWIKDSGEFMVPGVEDLVNIYDGSYVLMVTDSRGCTINSGSIDVQSALVSAQSISELGIRIFPNPVSKHLNIDNPENVPIQRVQVMNNTGRIVLEQSYQSFIDLSYFPSGIYWISLFSEGHRYITKLVKF